MPVEACRTAQEHIAHAQGLLAQAEDVGTGSLGGFSLALVQAHLDAAKTLAKIEEVQIARLSRLDAKGMTAGLQDVLGRIVPGDSEDL